MDRFEAIEVGKRCSRCGVWKTVGSFSARSSSSDGLSTQCTRCRRADWKNKYRETYITCPTCRQPKHERCYGKTSLTCIMCLEAGK